MNGSAPQQGPVIADHEDLYRALTNNDWYKVGRVSSAAFAFPKISTDVVSIADNQGCPPGEFTLSRFLPGTGLVRLNAGAAKASGAEARLEPENYNPAHAHLYMPRAKKARREIADLCGLIREPNLPDPPSGG